MTALPREIEADPSYARIRARIDAGHHRLWAGGQLLVPVLPLLPALAAALAAAARARHLVLGLEGAADALAAEAYGLAQRPGPAARARISRLLLLSQDGAERLYRHAERLGEMHAPRLLIALIGADAPTLGHTVTGRAAAVKAVLVQRKQAVAEVLRALAA
ncbi:MAG: hypothetical protein U0807_08055 [Candidatus Binatia bacterium]